MSITNKITTVRMAGIVVTLVTAASWTPFAVAQREAPAADTGVAQLSPPESKATYRNGTYSATGEYGGGPSYLPVTVTLANGVITQLEVKTPATNPISLVYQRRFATAVRQVVVGKPISEVKVGRMAGSSLTPDGFNAAIEQIKKQALSTN